MLAAAPDVLTCAQCRNIFLNESLAPTLWASLPLIIMRRIFHVYLTMLRSVPTQEGPEKSFKGWKKLPPDRIGDPEPVIKDAQEVPSKKDERQ